MAQLNTYRVWMKDGYMRLVSAETEEAAKAIAIERTTADLVEAAMSATEKRRATQVDFVDQLNQNK